MNNTIYADQTTLRMYADMKMSGKDVGIELLDSDLLTQLWAGDLASDHQIAQVFGCSTYEVHRLRDRYGINHKTCVKAYANSIASCLGNIGMAIMLT